MQSTRIGMEKAYIFLSHELFRETQVENRFVSKFKLHFNMRL